MHVFSLFEVGTCVGGGGTAAPKRLSNMAHGVRDILVISTNLFFYLQICMYLFYF